EPPRRRLRAFLVQAPGPRSISSYLHCNAREPEVVQAMASVSMRRGDDPVATPLGDARPRPEVTGGGNSAALPVKRPCPGCVDLFAYPVTRFVSGISSGWRRSRPLATPNRGP